MEEDKNSEPQTPEHHLFHSLHIQHPKYEDEFVEYEVPKLVLQVLSGKKSEHRHTSLFANQGRRKVSSLSVLKAILN